MKLKIMNKLPPVFFLMSTIILPSALAQDAASGRGAGTLAVLFLAIIAVAAIIHFTARKRRL
jgi:hypothetical protein